MLLRRNLRLLITILALIVSYTISYSQSDLYYIEKPSVAKHKGPIRDALILTEMDSIVGEFTSSFVTILSSELKELGIQSHIVYKTPEDVFGAAANTVDTILANYDPNGIILLTLKGSSIGKTSAFSPVVPCWVYDFQFSYRIDDEQKYIQLFATEIIIDMKGINKVGSAIAEDILKKMRRKKILKNISE